MHLHGQRTWKLVKHWNQSEALVVQWRTVKIVRSLMCCRNYLFAPSRSTCSKKQFNEYTICDWLIVKIQWYHWFLGVCLKKYSQEGFYTSSRRLRDMDFLLVPSKEAKHHTKWYRHRIFSQGYAILRLGNGMLLVKLWRGVSSDSGYFQAPLVCSFYLTIFFVTDGIASMWRRICRLGGEMLWVWERPTKGKLLSNSVFEKMNEKHKSSASTIARRSLTTSTPYITQISWDPGPGQR